MGGSRRHIHQLRDDFLEGISVPENRPFVADDFQTEAIKHLADGYDTLVIAPTGAGKTYIAIEAIRHTVSEGKRVVYTAPLKALSNAKYAEFRRIFHQDFSVGLLTGDRKIEGDSQLVVATTEIYRNELYRYSENYGLVVLDELHYLADPQRGPVWEESIILAPRSAKLLMLSASISNHQEIANWISGIRNREVKIVRVQQRPVEMRFGFIHPDFGVLPLTNNSGEILSEVDRYYNEAFARTASLGKFRRGRNGRGGGGRR
ncbi:MAG: DEAD/DEAH box helicase [Deltaproteobacteria bacterium]|nr:DEAD/DEAH box helicase [Deltaproteobacteria bacterium]